MVAPIDWLIEASTVLEDSVKFDSTEDGITSRAANATTLILALAAKCEPDYFLDYRVQQGVRRRVLLVLRHVQSRPGFRAVEFRSTVEPVVAALCRDAGPPRRVLECERAQCVLAVDTVMQGTAPAGVVTPKGARQRWWGRPLLYRDALRSCDLVDRTLTACPTTAEMAVQVAAGLSGREPPWLLNGDVLHDFFLDYADTAAALRLMRVAMALLAYRESHKRLPEALDQLAGYFADGIPVDPYSGAAFGYSPAEGRLWSVRPGMDDERKQVRGLVWLLDSSE
jgi:hypothetical protein